MWSWSVLVAAQNRVLTADALENSYLDLAAATMNDVEWGIGNDTAKAWHFYLNGETSCYWYWDYDRANPWDGNVTRAVQPGRRRGQQGHRPPSRRRSRGPSIFPPQRTPYNPGGKMWNEAANAASDFDVWTFVDDVSGLAAVKLCWRVDLDGVNPVQRDRQRGVRAERGQGQRVEQRADDRVLVAVRQGPERAGPGQPRAAVHSGRIAGQNDAMLDYFVEAVDTKGNTNRSDIFHVWVGESTGGGTGPYVEFDPASPNGCVPVTIKYKKSGSPLGAGQVYIHIGRNDWKDAITPDPAMTSSGDWWTYVYPAPTNTTEINACFNNGAGAWDNNGGQDWTLAVSNCGTNGGGSGTNASTVVFNPPAPSGCASVAITYTANDGPLKNAQPVFIHVGRNNWQGIITPDPSMTSLGGGVWRYAYVAPCRHLRDQLRLQQRARDHGQQQRPELEGGRHRAAATSPAS